MTDGWVHWNGKLQPAAEASVSTADRGLLLGWGCFETLQALGGQPYAFTRHFLRLEAGALALGLAAPEKEELLGHCRAVLEANGPEKARLRITLTAGPDEGAPSLLIATSALPQRAATSRVLFSRRRRERGGGLTRLKTVSYLDNVLALREATRQGADESLLFDEAGQLCEGATSNVFLVREGQVWTPPLSSGCLPGVTRELVLELAAKFGLRCHQAAIDRASLFQAEELFLTSSTRDVQGIAQCQDHLLEGAPGALTRQLQEAFHEWQREVIDP
ncbi:MAG: aminotransferase class IV [Verrucomicrobiota bacterium]